MGKPEREPGGLPALEPVLGYLNFSAGAADPQFLAHLNGLFEFAAIQGSSRPLWQAVHDLLARRLRELAESSPTFRDSAQAAAVLDLVFAKMLPAYRQFHRDLLFHQTESTLFRPFFVGRVCEAVLSQGGPWDEPERIVPAAIRQLNDFSAIVRSRRSKRSGWSPTPTSSSGRFRSISAVPGSASGRNAR
jgi:hypothetical protein